MRYPDLAVAHHSNHCSFHTTPDRRGILTVMQDPFLQSMLQTLPIPSSPIESLKDRTQDVFDNHWEQPKTAMPEGSESVGTSDLVAIRQDTRILHPLERHKLKNRELAVSRLSKLRKTHLKDRLIGKKVPTSTPKSLVVAVAKSVDHETLMSLEANLTPRSGSSMGLSTGQFASELDLDNLFSPMSTASLSSMSEWRTDSPLSSRGLIYDHHQEKAGKDIFPTVRVGVIAAEGVAAPFEDLICVLRIGDEDIVSLGPAMCFPVDEQHSRVDWNAEYATNLVSIGNLYSSI